MLHVDTFTHGESLRDTVEQTPTVSQAQVYASLAEGKSIFLAGDAGTGKSFVTDTFITDFYDTVKAIPGQKQLARTGILVTASTGIAAANIGGRTIHSVSGLGRCRRPLDMDSIDDPTYRNTMLLGRNFDKQQLALAAARMIVLDEVSMVDKVFIDNLSHVLQKAKNNDKPFGGISMVFVGDFMQLPPVRGQGFAFEADEWKRLNPEMLYMGTPQRSIDENLNSLLLDMREADGDLKDSSYLTLQQALRRKPEQSYVRLFTRNVDVDGYNEDRLAKLDEKPVSFRATIQGRNCATDQLKEEATQICSNFCKRMGLDPEQGLQRTLKKGAVVMITSNHIPEHNNETIPLVNGDTGIVTDIITDAHGIGQQASVYVNRLDREVLISPVKVTETTKPVENPNYKPKLKEDGTIDENAPKDDEFIRAKVDFEYLPLKVAFATTIHKSQGQTLDGVCVDLSDCFEPNLGYVALSRVTSADRLCITNIDKRAFARDDQCVAFSRQLKIESLRNRQKFLERNLSKLEHDIETGDIIRRNDAWIDQPDTVLKRLGFDPQDSTHKRKDIDFSRLIATDEKKRRAPQAPHPDPHGDIAREIDQWAKQGRDERETHRDSPHPDNNPELDLGW